MVWPLLAILACSMVLAVSFVLVMLLTRSGYHGLSLFHGFRVVGPEQEKKLREAWIKLTGNLSAPIDPSTALRNLLPNLPRRYQDVGKTGRESRREAERQRGRSSEGGEGGGEGECVCACV